MLKFCPLGNKNKRMFFIQMKTSDFILHGGKPKLAIKIETENIFYPIYIYVKGCTFLPFTIIFSTRFFFSSKVLMMYILDEHTRESVMNN
jgi:hypothetical protein